MMSYPNLHYYENYVDADNYGEVYKSLNNLPLYKYQGELHKFIDKSKSSALDHHCNYCENFIADLHEAGSRLRKLCKGICYILQNFNDIKSTSKEISEDKWCPYMNSWLYNYVLSIPNYNKYISNFYLALRFICQSPKNQLQKCTFENYSIDKTTFNNKKILNEFAEIYEDIKNKIFHEDNLDVQTYCKHIKENFRFYNIAKENCNSNNCNYFTELQQFKNKINKLGDLDTILNKCKYKKTSCEQGSNGEDDVPCLKEKGNSFLFLIFGNDPEDIINVLLNITLISAPILVLFLILLKFTPFGKPLRKLKQERRKTGHKKKDENIQDYMNNYAAYVDNEIKNRVNLAYHAI